MKNERLKIAIQKKGRLSKDSIDILQRCGLKFRIFANALITKCESLPIDILLVRDDDIPTLVMDGICDMGIVGENALFEKKYSLTDNGKSADFEVAQRLGFGRCRLSLALPENVAYQSPGDLQGLRIATSYPYLLKQYLQKNKLDAKVLSLSGSVEIAPRLGMSDAICDLVSSGRTLEENKLKEVAILIKSEAVLIQSNKTMSDDKLNIADLLLRRVKGVLKASESKYIIFHAPQSALQVIKEILPGTESPTITPLNGVDEKVSVQVVSREGVFWNTLEQLKSIGASSILVLPIEKMMA